MHANATGCFLTLCGILVQHVRKPWGYFSVHYPITWQFYLQAILYVFNMQSVDPTDTAGTSTRDRSRRNCPNQVHVN